MRQQRAKTDRPVVRRHSTALAEPAPCFEDPAGRTGIVGFAPKIPMIAQRRLVFRPPLLARQNRGAAKCEALTPQHAEQMFVTGDWMQGGERRPGEKVRILNGLRGCRQPRPAWKDRKDRRWIVCDSRARGHIQA